MVENEQDVIITRKEYEDSVLKEKQLTGILNLLDRLMHEEISSDEFCAEAGFLYLDRT